MESKSLKSMYSLLHLHRKIPCLRLNSKVNCKSDFDGLVIELLLKMGRVLLLGIKLTRSRSFNTCIIRNFIIFDFTFFCLITTNWIDIFFQRLTHTHTQNYFSDSVHFCGVHFHLKFSFTRKSKVCLINFDDEYRVSRKSRLPPSIRKKKRVEGDLVIEFSNYFCFHYKSLLFRFFFAFVQKLLRP